MVGVAPGGAGQSMLGLDWGHRTGYAVVGVKARVPVITLVTDNIDSAYTASSLTYPVSYLLFRYTKVSQFIIIYRRKLTKYHHQTALALVYGGLPVKLTSSL